MLDTGRRDRVSYPSAKWCRRLESAYLRPSASWLSSTPNLSGRVQPDRLQYVFFGVVRGVLNQAYEPLGVQQHVPKPLLHLAGRWH